MKWQGSKVHLVILLEFCESVGPGCSHWGPGYGANLVVGVKVENPIYIMQAKVVGPSNGAKSLNEKEKTKC